MLGSRCTQCGRIATDRKKKPRRPWRRQSSIEMGCMCGNRWRVHVSTAAKRPAPLARVASLLRRR